MHSRVVFAALLVNGATLPWLAHVEAIACAEICYTTELTGFAPGGVPGCTCSGSQAGARTGSGGCNCGQCYEQTQGVVYGFAVNADGTCTYGTDCGSCDLIGLPTSSSDGTSSRSGATTSGSTSDGSSMTNDTSTDSSSLSTSDSTSASSGASLDSGSSSSKNDAGDSHAGSEAIDKKLSTWQIALAICCTVLLFLVAVVSVFACYCKARSRLYEHEEDPAGYYNQDINHAITFQPWAANPTGPLPVHALPQVTKTANIVQSC